MFARKRKPEPEPTAPATPPLPLPLPSPALPALPEDTDEEPQSPLLSSRQRPPQLAIPEQDDMQYSASTSAFERYGFSDLEGGGGAEPAARVKGHPVAPRMRTVPSWFPQNRHLHGPGLQLYRLLTIMVLSVTCIVSFCFIFFLIPTSFTTHLPALPADDFTWARQTFGGLQNLVLVPGHSVFVGDDLQRADAMSSWYLEPYQRVPGQVDSFVEHIRGGVLAAAADPRALLLFSGGETRAAAGPISEAASYWMVAQGQAWFGFGDDVKWRAGTEEHARDSLENLLFAVCRFYELTGHFPHNITVVGYEFKRQRFEQLHRSALRFPARRFMYVGTPAPDPAAAATGEHVTLRAFQEDPYGCQGSLRKKRLSRDPFAHGVAYVHRVPDSLRPLLLYCGPALYDAELPWHEHLSLGGEGTWHDHHVRVKPGSRRLEGAPRSDLKVIEA